MNNDQLIDVLLDCAKACKVCASSCLAEKDVTMLAYCIKTDMECAEICTVTAESIIRNSPVLNKLLDACIDICRICAEECEKHASHMEHCRICAKACRKCEESCMELV